MASILVIETVCTALTAGAGINRAAMLAIPAATRRSRAAVFSVCVMQTSSAVLLTELSRHAYLFQDSSQRTRQHPGQGSLDRGGSLTGARLVRRPATAAEGRRALRAGRRGPRAGRAAALAQARGDARPPAPGAAQARARA